MYRYFVKNTIESIALESLNYIEPNNVYKINEKIDDKNVMIYGYCYDINIILLTDIDYPPYLVYSLFRDLRNNIKSDNVEKIWNNYHEGKNADKVQQIKSELDETKVILLESIEKLLERGEKIDELVKKTEELNVGAITFAKKSKELNRCCIIL
jgi:hypothetical protein